VKESIRLRLSEEGEDACLRVAWGSDDVICAGFKSGFVALWRLQQLHSPRMLKDEGVFILDPFRAFKAHNTPVLSKKFFS